MQIAIIGGGASGMITAYLLEKQGHQVTVFEKQSILGGHIRTLNQNVKPNHSDSNLILECGVLEFPVVFHNFINLMQELGIELEPVNTGSGLFLQDGSHFLSGGMIKKNYQGWQRFLEYIRLDTLYARSAGLLAKIKFGQESAFHHHPMSDYLQGQCIRNCWLKLLLMYSYSMSFDLIDQFPAALGIPIVRDYVFVDWLRIKGGVYSYIKKIQENLRGKIFLNAEIVGISRQDNTVTLHLSPGVEKQFNHLVFATPPDQILTLLSDPTEAEIKRFSLWKKNQATTIIHHDHSIYQRYGIAKFSEFDFFQTDKGWGYNAYLNQICAISSSDKYSLAFDLETLIAKDKIVHIQEHHTPLYTVNAFEFVDAIIKTNGENNTYYAGAYLADGLHEGAVTSALRVAQLIGH
ncbi:FAD-dependent oxidoreductase [Crocosphaera sp. UHCC 0190]|uniref:FAD-dependent oxidoreductase n=1 Tax=Crocosphaera sp. UHCC 0190 TaxID=3110246 RepID=UPI002B2100FE|nr:FAD-dependent oxidoreductase [Crocosphaera sp. UHCC 0190]MEA5509972.1 FAD-dependent oxidoreductase [Crocosphaera sp. UHCC 0190]